MKARRYLDRQTLPPHWITVLDQIQKAEPGAIIAGGALRDFDMGIPSKDLDIFVPYEVNMKAVKAEVANLYSLWDDGQEYFFQDHAPFQVFKAMPDEFQGLPKLEIIRCVEGINPHDRWPEFDFGACQISFDGHQMRATAQYLKDTDAHEFTLTRADTVEALHRSIKRVRRWQAREYADWSLVIPSRFMPLLTLQELNDAQ